MTDNSIVKEITVSLSGVIPVAAYENMRPGYSITVEPQNGSSPEKVITNCETLLHKMFENAANRAKADDIKRTYASLRWYEKDGKEYPSVTSILGWNVDMAKMCRMTPDELLQYACRGNIVEAMINEYLRHGEWLEPSMIPSIREDVAVLETGSLGMTWKVCSYKEFIAKFESKIKVEAIQKTVFNDEHLYAGTEDILGEYDGVKSVIDIKCRKGGWDMRQLAAYAKCEKDVKQIVIFPVGECDNVCGYKKPVICTTIQAEFEKFIIARAAFKRRFNI